MELPPTDFESANLAAAAVVLSGKSKEEKTTAGQQVHSD
jgi:hypothetical protein